MASLNIAITSDLDRAARYAGAMAKQMRYAASVALNNTAFDARGSVKGATRQYFNEPTTFIQNAYRVGKATKLTLAAVLYPERARVPYLKANVYGGQRGTKPFEAKYLGEASESLSSGLKLIPAAIRRNSQGNVSLAALKRLSGLIATTGSNSIFVGTPTGGNRPPGVYQRAPRGILRPLFVAVPSATYRPIFPVDEITQKVVQRRFANYYQSALEKAIASAR